MSANVTRGGALSLQDGLRLGMNWHTATPMRFVFQRKPAPTLMLLNWIEGSQNNLYKPDNPTSSKPFSSPQRAPLSAASPPDKKPSLNIF